MSELLNGVNLENIGQLAEAVKADNSVGKITFFAKSKWVAGTKTEVTVNKINSNGQDITRQGREFKFYVDEPAQLGGLDEAPNPVEYVIGGLCGCITGAIASNAALFGTKLDEIEVSVEAGCDLVGVFGFDKSVSSGLSNLKYSVKLKGPDSKEKMLKSKETIDKKSSVLNTLKNTLPVETSAEIG